MARMKTLNVVQPGNGLRPEERFVIEACSHRFEHPKEYVSKKTGQRGKSQIIPVRDLAEGLRLINPKYASQEERIALLDGMKGIGLIRSAWCGAPAVADNRYAPASGTGDSGTFAALAKKYVS